MTTYTDLAYLKDLTDNDDDLIAESLKRYLKSSPVGLERLQKATAAKDWKEIHDSAHSLFSTTQIIGLTAIAQPLKDIQNNATEINDIDAIEKDVQFIEQVITASHTEVNEYLHQYEH